LTLILTAPGLVIARSSRPVRSVNELVTRLGATASGPTELDFGEDMDMVKSQQL